MSKSKYIYICAVSIDNLAFTSLFGHFQNPIAQVMSDKTGHKQRILT